MKLIIYLRFGSRTTHRPLLYYPSTLLTWSTHLCLFVSDLSTHPLFPSSIYLPTPSLLLPHPYLHPFQLNQVHISLMSLPRFCLGSDISLGENMPETEPPHWGPVHTESRVNESGFIFHTDRIFNCVHMEPGSEKFACTRPQRDPAGRRGAFTVSRRNEHSVSRMVSRVKPTNYGV